MMRSRATVRLGHLARVLARAPWLPWLSRAPWVSWTLSRCAQAGDETEAQREHALLKLLVYALPEREAAILLACAGEQQARRLARRARALGYRSAQATSLARIAAVEARQPPAHETVLLAGDALSPPLLAAAARVAQRRLIVALESSPDGGASAMGGDTPASLAASATALGLIAEPPPAEPLAGLQAMIFRWPATLEPRLLSQKPLAGMPATIVSTQATIASTQVQRSEGEREPERGLGDVARGLPIHFDVDLSRPGSFTWVTAELAVALVALGQPVSLRPGALSETIPPDRRAMLAARQQPPAAGSRVVGWDHPFDEPQVPRDFEFFVINYRFRKRNPEGFDPWMRRVLASQTTKLCVSRFCREVLVEAGFPAERCRIVGHGYSPAIDRVAGRAFLPMGRRFTFLSVVNAHDLSRSGTDLLLRGFEAAFTPKEAVALVLRDYGAFNPELAAQVERLQQRGFHVLYFARLLEADDVVRFYRACDALVAPFRGEGFAIKILDALACGLPVLAPLYGGPADYLHEGNAIPLDWREVPLGDCLDRRLFAPGNDPVWCEVEVDELAKKLAAVYADPALARARAARGRREVLQRFSWPAIARDLLAALQE